MAPRLIRLAVTLNTRIIDKSEEHCQRDDGCYNQSGTEVAEEEDEYKEDDNRSFNQVVDNRRDVSVYQFRTVQVRFYTDSFG